MAIIMLECLELYRQHISRDIIGAHKLLCMMKHGQAGNIIVGYSDFSSKHNEKYLNVKLLRLNSLQHLLKTEGKPGAHNLTCKLY